MQKLDCKPRFEIFGQHVRTNRKALGVVILIIGGGVVMVVAVIVMMKQMPLRNP